MVERSLALALREAVTNVVRHAEARRCEIRVEHHDGAWHLHVVDDGRGSLGAVEGNGLRGMRERITAVGGHVERAAARSARLRVGAAARLPSVGRAGGGTHLTVTVPG
ncbi:sensor histidine kinase [Euzebya sp.]|uniref:sensor histidine kinase n=1 Tax=Euzebya sp. TaxID=1971409 RepID=UPI003511745B